MGIKYLGKVVSIRWRDFLTGFYLGICLCAPVWADPVAVIYPEVREPYQQVFLNIAEGVEAELNHSVKHLKLEKTDTSAQSWLSKNSITGVVALGNHSINALGLDADLPFVAGAITQLDSDSNIYAVTLNPAPDLLFAGLLALAPEVTSVHVVYDHVRNQREVENAIAVATSLNLKIKTYPVEDLREAALAYRDVQDNIQPKVDALWLPLGGPARDKAIMQSVLETAWTKDQIVFSSNLADVKRGVLFAMYPDNVGMGRQLARMLRQIKDGNPPQPAIQFVRSLFKAINRRTAEHLELRVSNQDLATYEFVHPPQ